MSFGAAAQNLSNPNLSDVEVVNPPADSVSKLFFSPTPSPNILVSTSWDGVIRCWEVAGNGTTRHVLDQQQPQPILDACFHNDGTKVFTAGCDKTVQMWDMQANKMQQVGVHDAPVRSCNWVQENQILMTCSWDKKIRYWDCRQSTPALETTVPERIYCSAYTAGLAVACLADRNIAVYDMRNPSTPYRTFMSLLKYQTRCVATFPDIPRQTNAGTPGKGFAYGSIEGRVALHYVEEPLDSKAHFSFKCHRDPTTGTASNRQRVYAVNDISFHPQYGTFSTAGADGTFHYWDKDNKQRLKAFPSNSTQTFNPPKWQDGSVAPITATAFSADGSIFAYAFSYDWGKGYAAYDPNVMKPHIYLHPVGDDARPRPK